MYLVKCITLVAAAFISSAPTVQKRANVTLLCFDFSALFWLQCNPLCPLSSLTFVVLLSKKILNMFSHGPPGYHNGIIKNLDRDHPVCISTCWGQGCKFAHATIYYSFLHSFVFNLLLRCACSATATNRA